MSGLQVVLNPNVLVPDLNAVVFQTELGVCTPTEL